MQKTLVSLPYIYPLCPLNFNHAKLFVIADIVCRHQRTKGKAVIFPIGSHYSGNTAQKAVEALTRYFAGTKNAQDKAIYQLYENFYKTPRYILKTFSSPDYLLDYYTHEIYWELKSLSVSADYDFEYNTSHEDYSVFIKSILKYYEKSGLLIKNKNNDLALDYDNLIWKEKAINLINNTYFNTNSHKNNILSSIKNVRTDWKLLRDTGSGVKYQNQIIDPMFDSELFALFDLYMRFKDEFRSDCDNSQKFFDELLLALNSSHKSQNSLVNAIINCLPCDIFICEEHLKNWIVKKFYAESILLHSEFQTKKYLFIGMGLLDGKRMSASKNHSILSKDLINQYGAKTARLVLLLSGGNIAKSCSYDRNLPSFAIKLMENLSAYLIGLISKSKQNLNNLLETSSLKPDENTVIIEEHINTGYYRQAIIELFINIPKKNRNPDKSTIVNLLSFYRKYLDIFLPGYFNNLK